MKQPPPPRQQQPRTAREQIEREHKRFVEMKYRDAESRERYKNVRAFPILEREE